MWLAYLCKVQSNFVQSTSQIKFNFVLPAADFDRLSVVLEACWWEISMAFTRVLLDTYTRNTDIEWATFLLRRVGIEWANFLRQRQTHTPHGADFPENSSLITNHACLPWLNETKPTSFIAHCCFCLGTFYIGSLAINFMYIHAYYAKFKKNIANFLFSTPGPASKLNVGSVLCNGMDI